MITKKMYQDGIRCKGICSICRTWKGCYQGEIRYKEENKRYLCDSNKNKECKKTRCQKDCFHTKIKKYEIGDKENE